MQLVLIVVVGWAVSESYTHFQLVLPSCRADAGGGRLTSGIRWAHGFLVLEQR